MSARKICHNILNVWYKCGHFQYSLRPCQHWGDWKRGNENARQSKSGTRKHETDTCYWIQRLTKNITYTSGPCKPKTVNSALRHQWRYVIQFKIINNNNNNNNNDIFTVFALQINRRAPGTPHITFLVPVVIQLLVSRIERYKAWLDCFFGFVSLAIQRLPYFSPHFPVPRFLLPRYQRPLNTQHCIYMSLQKLGNEQLTH